MVGWRLREEGVEKHEERKIRGVSWYEYQSFFL